MTTSAASTRHTVVRPYRDSDLVSVAELFTASIHALAATHYDAAQRAAWAPPTPDLDDWRDRLSSLTTLIAERDARLAGFLSYEADGHIDLLFTAPAHAREGIASTLYKLAEEALCATGVELLFTEASLISRPFFARQGFSVTEEQFVTLRGVSLVRYAMQKRLQPALR